MHRHALPLLAAAALLCVAGCGDDAPPPSAAAPELPVPTAAATSSSAVPSTTTATTSPAAATASPTATGPQPCATSALGVGVGAAEGAAGSTYTSVQFVNRGPATCTLSGHPGVSFVAGSDGEQVGASARREGTPVRVTLVPGGRAHAALRIVNAGNYDAEACRPVQVRGFRVFPPDQTASAFVPQAQTACSSGSVVTLTISEVEAGVGA